MTLMPVTRIAASVDWSTNGGASAWIGARHVAADRAALVDRLADDVHDAAERLRADRHADLRAGGVDRLAAGQAVGRVHRDGADDVLAEVLGDLEHQAVAAVVGLERGQDRRKLALERDVDDGADDLRDAADEVARLRRRRFGAGGGASAFLARLRGLVSGAAVAMSVFLALRVRLERFGAGNDFDELGGDRGLALAVVLDRQAVDHVAGVAGRIVHRGHLRAVEAGLVLEQRAIDLDRDVARQQVGEDLLLVGLIFDRGERGRAGRRARRRRAARPG